jgi:hypothetical protein
MWNGSAFLALATALTGAISAQTIRFGPGSSPAGTSAQLAIQMSQPVPLTKGRIVVALDPTIFGDADGVELHGATGDQYGYATLDGRRAAIHFIPPSAGVGRLPNVPLITVRAPVLGTARPGTATAVLRIESAVLTGEAGEELSLGSEPEPGSFVVGGNLSIEDVIPNAGIFPAGTPVLIKGTGFDSGTTAAIESVATSASRVISREWIELVLQAPADLTTRRLTIHHPQGEVLEHFISWRGTQKGPHPKFLPLFARAEQTIANARLGTAPSFNTALAVRNVGRERSAVTVESIDIFGQGLGANAFTAASIIVGPGEVVVCEEC